MKGFLDKISLVFENLKDKQIDVLDDYYKMVQGGIAFQIRRVITRPIKGAAYGYIERKLYNMLIYNASKIYKVQKKREKKEEEEKLLKELFLLHGEKYNSLPLKEKIFDEYKKY